MLLYENGVQDIRVDTFFFIYLLKFTICPIWTFGRIF